MQQNVRAAGVIPYMLKNGVAYFLLVKTNEKGYSDFGGKIENNETPQEIAAREASEESNGIFNREDVLQKIGTSYLYIPTSKYALFFYPLSTLPSPADFGQRELHTGYPLNVVLCNTQDKFDLQWHPRISKSRHIIIRELQRRAYIQKSRHSPLPSCT